MGMAPEGLGPSTPGFKVRCSAQLSYEAVKQTATPRVGGVDTTNLSRVTGGFQIVLATAIDLSRLFSFVSVPLKLTRRKR
jgi:hypothetical protein